MQKISITCKISLIIFFIIVFIAFFAPLISFHPYNIPSGEPLQSPCRIHLLGTDDLGMDIWAQMCYGARISMIVGLGTAVIAVLIGTFMGTAAGYFGGYIDNILMRFTDMMIVFPQLPAMIVLGAFFGPSVKNIIIVLSIFSWTTSARVIRSKVAAVRQEKYIKVAKSYGASFGYVFFKHILPQIFPLIIISFVKLISRAVVAEASLSFLGLGDPTSKSWGVVLHQAMNFNGIYFTPYWKWWVLSPIIAIILLVVSLAFVVREFENKFKYKV